MLEEQDPSQLAASGVVGDGKLASDPLVPEIINAEGDVISDLLGIEMPVVLPYRGAAMNSADIQVLRSENGEFWINLGSESVVRVQPAQNE